MKHALLSAALAFFALFAMPGLASATTTEPPPPPPNNAPAQPPAPSAPAAAPRMVRVRVLTQCEHGEPNDVVSLTADDAKAAEKAGLVNSGKADVEYAAALPQNQPKPKPGT